MQTWLPLPDWEESARVLDDRRLGLQRPKTLLIFESAIGAKLNNDTGAVVATAVGYQDHPAVRTWERDLSALLAYQYYFCEEWKQRGFKDTCWEKTSRLFAYVTDSDSLVTRIGTGTPWWWGREDFHASHRATLLHRAPDWYGQFGWAEAPDDRYIWPV